MAKITRIPPGAKEQGGRIYDMSAPCRRCGHFRTSTDGLGHCVYRMTGFDPDRVIQCGDKWTDIQQRRIKSV